MPKSSSNHPKLAKYVPPPLRSSGRLPPPPIPQFHRPLQRLLVLYEKRTPRPQEKSTKRRKTSSTSSSRQKAGKTSQKRVKNPCERPPPATFAPSAGQQRPTSDVGWIKSFFTDSSPNLERRPPIKQLRTPSFLDHAADFTSNDPETTTNEHRRPNEHFTERPATAPNFPFPRHTSFSAKSPSIEDLRRAFSVF